MLPGDDEHVHRRQPPYVLEGEHLILFVYHLGFHLPTRYLTEYAVVLAHVQLLSTTPRLCRAARATATIPAVSLRNRYGPSCARARPASSANRISSSLHPPSGPTKRLTGEERTASSGTRSGALCSKTPSSPIGRTTSEKCTGSRTSGTRRRRDCRAAAPATRRQRSTLL